jgi:hypothetical protein
MNAAHEQTETFRTGFFGPWVSLLGGWQVLIKRVDTHWRSQPVPLLRLPWTQVSWTVLVYKATLEFLVGVLSLEVIQAPFQAFQ